MVYSPDRTNNTDERVNQLAEGMRTLRDESGLTSAQHEYLRSTAPPELRRLHDRLINETTHTVQLATLEHSRLTGQGNVSSGIPIHELIGQLNNLSDRWSGMRDTIQTAQDSNVTSQNTQGRVILNPSGSMRWGHES
ncbi:hypothetical protein P4S72_02025 [Vibrio sp. PP-XX7]